MWSLHYDDQAMTNGTRTPVLHTFKTADLLQETTVIFHSDMLAIVCEKQE